MKKFLFILLSLFLVSTNILFAQFDSQISNFGAIKNYYNPGYAGQSGLLQLTALSRLQWVGIEGAPKTTIISAEMPLNLFGREHGVGVSMYNDRQGLFSANVISGQYSYKTKLFGGNLGIGLQFGFINETFDATKISIPEESEDHDNNDTAKPTGNEVKGTSIDAGFGIYWHNKRLYAGLSVQHLLAPELELQEKYVLEIPRTYYFTAGYNIPLNNPFIELQPSVLVKTIEPSSFVVEGDSILVEVEKRNVMKAMLTQTQIDVSLKLTYNKMFWAGLSWRNKDAVVVMLGGRLKMFELGYAYDYPISAIRGGSWGSHELYIKYAVDLSKKKKGNTKHKSVRIL